MAFCQSSPPLDILVASPRLLIVRNVVVHVPGLGVRDFSGGAQVVISKMFTRKVDVMTQDSHYSHTTL